MIEDWIILGRVTAGRKGRLYRSRCRMCGGSEKLRRGSILARCRGCKSCCQRTGPHLVTNKEAKLKANPYLPERLGSRSVQRIKCCRQKTCHQCAGDGYYFEVKKTQRTARGKAALYEEVAP